jgi:hypothetical protein
MKKYAHQATKAGPAVEQDGLGTDANPRKRRKVGARADSGGSSSAKDAKASSSTAAAQGMKEKLGDPQLLRPLRLIIVGHNPSEVGGCLLLLLLLIVVLGSLDERWMCHHGGRETAPTQECCMDDCVTLHVLLRSQTTWRVGHAYAHPSNHMWRILIKTGIAPPGVTGAVDDDRMPALAGVVSDNLQCKL